MNWPSNTFCITNHQNDATGTIALSIKRSDGNVGIGTDNPGAKLHIYDGASETEIFMGESATDKSGIIKYEQGDGSGTGKMLIGNWGDSLLTKSLCVKKGGNVGIGTDGPSQKLHVNEGKISVTHGHGILIDSYGDGAGPRIGFGSIADQDNILKIGCFDNHNNIDTPEANRDLRIRFGASPVTSTTFKHNGNVGIGTTDPEKTVHIFEGGLEIEEQGTGSIDSVPIPEINLRQSRYSNHHTNDEL